MNDIPPPLRIVVADDDPDDRMLLREAFDECGLTTVSKEIMFVQNGEELLDCLRGRGPFTKPGFEGTTFDAPPLVILDLNMPRMDGREALKAIKNNASLRCIPVVVLTTSSQENDVDACYQQGASSFITKPEKYNDLVRMARQVKEYWLDIVKRPRHFDPS